MKQYKVQVAREAERDLEQIYDYIANTLQAPGTALKQYDRLADGIMSLQIFPERCRLFDTEPERRKGMRRLLVDRYSVIYVVQGGVVSVLRVLYSSSDLAARLRENR